MIAACAFHRLRTDAAAGLEMDVEPGLRIG
jgi:hypothetical protein